MTAYHVRLDEARTLCATAGRPRPDQPDDPQVPTAAQMVLQSLGYDPDNFRPWWDD